MTQRDWKKDMEMCEATTKGPWIAKAWTVPTADQYNITSEHDNSELYTAWQGTRYPGAPEVSAYQAKLNAIFAAEVRTALPYWLQEAKIYKQSYEGTLIEYKSEKARADDAEIWRDKAYNRVGHQAQEISELRVALAESEAREQRLKETMESIIPLINTGSVGGMVDMLMDVLRTLYPDTPAPKEGNNEPCEIKRCD